MLYCHKVYIRDSRFLQTQELFLQQQLRKKKQYFLQTSERPYCLTTLPSRSVHFTDNTARCTPPPCPPIPYPTPTSARIKQRLPSHPRLLLRPLVLRASLRYLLRQSKTASPTPRVKMAWL